MGKKFAVNEKFFVNWNPKMAYVLGFIYADGSIHISARGRYTTITSTDKEIIYKIKRWLRSDHTVNILESVWPKGKLRFFIRIGNKNLYKSLEEKGLFPNKSLSVKIPRIPTNYFKDFVRGYFDGDGCVYLERSKGKKQDLILKKLTVIFTSGSEMFLKELLKKLKKILDLKQNKIYNSRRSFQLRFNTTDSICLFNFLYKSRRKELFFIRKFKIFVKYFKLRPQRINKDIKFILKNMA